MARELLPDLDAPLDLDALRAAADAPGECCVVTRRWLQQVAAEISAGRAAMALQGQTFSRTQL